MKKILVYRIGSIGDTLVALPSFHAIRAAFPNAHISLLTNGDSNNVHNLIAKEMLPDGLFDEWIAYPQITLQNIKNLISELRKRNFEAAFYLMTRNRTYLRIKRDILFFRLAGIKKIYGVDYLLKNLLTMKPAKPVRRVESELEFFLDAILSENLNFTSKTSYSPDLRITAAERFFAEQWLENNCGSDWKQKKIIAVMPSTNWESKIWAEENFIQVVSLLIKDKEVFPVVFGGKSDREKGDKFVKNWKIGRNAAGELNLRQVAAVLSYCKIYLGTDTGVMHLAGAVGTPCVAVFAAHDYPGRWHPYGANHKIFRERVECEGCFSPKCFNNQKCLNLIKSENVYRACLELLENA
jgi:heptosyltransferase III